jgi:hypothetical protein
MRSLILLFVFTFVAVISHAQSDSAKVDKTPGFMRTHKSSVNLGYGKAWAINAGPFAEYFPAKYSQDYGQELTVFSLNISTPMWIGKGSSTESTAFDSNLGINYRYSESLEINDSTYYSFGIADFNFALGYDLFHFWKNFDLPVRAGFDLGMAALNHSGNWYRNPFLGALIQIQPRILLGPIALSFKAEFCFDLSSQSWKPYGISNQLALKNHYRMMMVSLGYVFR